MNALIVAFQPDGQLVLGWGDHNRKIAHISNQFMTQFLPHSCYYPIGAVFTLGGLMLRFLAYDPAGIWTVERVTYGIW